MALQKVVTALAGYTVILRGELFTVGDRISTGGVRGDVISVDFLTTHIFEMGHAPAEQQQPPTSWVRSRQPTGRIVSVSNARVFDDPVCNYSQGFPYVWEEISIPIPYTADRQRAEEVLLKAAASHTEDVITALTTAPMALERRSSRAPGGADLVSARTTDRHKRLP